MYWKLEALTAKKRFITKVIEGTYDEVLADAALYEFKILRVTPDYFSVLKNLFQSRKLSSAILAVFFHDFADMLGSGMSMHESLTNLGETTSNRFLKDALKKQINYLNDGKSLQEAFEYTKIFPKIVIATISAAEETGSIVELLEILSTYYTFRDENNKKIIEALIYPAVVFLLLTGLSIFISVKIVPQLRLLFHSDNLSTTILINYADFIKNYWWLVILALVGLCFIIKYLWEKKREALMDKVFAIPVFGNLMKCLELANVFLNLYVYQKSGINIVKTLTNVYEARPTYVTEKLVAIRDHIVNGGSIAEAFRKDGFWPLFISQNMTKGQVSGEVPRYLEIIYRFYDKKSKEAIKAMLAIIGPALLFLTAGFLLMIAYAFFYPIYSGMNHMGPGGFK